MYLSHFFIQGTKELSPRKIGPKNLQTFRHSLSGLETIKSLSDRREISTVHTNSKPFNLLQQRPATLNHTIHAPIRLNDM